MKQKNVTQYSCDFCSKKLFRKPVMIRHESECGNNPDNFSKCIQCEFCNKEQRNFTIDSFDGNFTERETIFNVYYCSKIKRMIYSTKAKKLIDKYPNVFEEQIPMLKKCKHYKPNYDKL